VTNQHFYLDVFDIPNSIHPIKSYKYHSQNTVLSMAVTDKALLHAILAYSMINKFCFETDPVPSHLEKIRFIEGNPEFLYHRIQAMCLVNKKLASGIVCDTTIATVLTLILHHVSSPCSLITI
jgi:hypothetical protein